MSSPFATPQATPIPSPTAKTVTIEVPGCFPNMSAERNAESPSTEPTDRSTFRVRTTIVSPIASSAKIVVSTRTNWSSETLRNRDWMSAVTSTSRPSTAMIPNSRIRKTRSTSRLGFELDERRRRLGVG